MLDREADEVAKASKGQSITHSQPVDADGETMHSLRSVALLLKGLYGQMNEEREVITLASGQMVHSVKQFEQHLQQFEALENACKQAIVERVKIELKQSVRESAQTIAQEVTDIAYEPINRGINSLCQLSTEMTQHRTQQERSRRRFLALFLSAALLGGMVSGLAVHYLTSPSKEIKMKLAAGETLMRSWNKLSKVEQEKIMRLGRIKTV